VKLSKARYLAFLDGGARLESRNTHRVLVDAEFDDERDRTFVRKELGAKHDASQAGKEKLAGSWSARRDANSVSSVRLRKAGVDGNFVLRGKAQAVRSRTGTNHRDTRCQALLLGLAYNIYWL
jgi:hypothetical protein